jgi:hypothetical protein
LLSFDPGGVWKALPRRACPDWIRIIEALINVKYIKIREYLVSWYSHRAHILALASVWDIRTQLILLDTPKD